MRLIDADKIPYVQDVTYMKDYDYAYRYAIEAEHTVDAIPIEFIKSEIARMKEGLNPHHPECAIYAENLGILIEEWERSKKEYETD